MNDAMATAAALQQGRDELWKRRPPLADGCEHDLIWLLCIEVRQSVVCRKCGGLDVESSRLVVTGAGDYALDDGGNPVRVLASGARVRLEENRGEEETG